MKQGWKIFLGIIGAVILLVLGAGIYRAVKKANEGKNGNGSKKESSTGNGDENDTKSGE